MDGSSDNTSTPKIISDIVRRETGGGATGSTQTTCDRSLLEIEPEPDEALKFNSHFIEIKRARIGTTSQGGYQPNPEYGYSV